MRRLAFLSSTLLVGFCFLVTIAFASVHSLPEGYVWHTQPTVDLSRICHARGWARTDDQPSDEEILSVIVAVKQRNTNVLYRELEAVSNPDSPRYGALNLSLFLSFFSDILLLFFMF